MFQIRSPTWKLHHFFDKRYEADLKASSCRCAARMDDGRGQPIRLRGVLFYQGENNFTGCRLGLQVFGIVQIAGWSKRSMTYDMNHPTIRMSVQVKTGVGGF